MEIEIVQTKIKPKKFFTSSVPLSFSQIYGSKKLASITFQVSSSRGIIDDNLKSGVTP